MSELKQRIYQIRVGARLDETWLEWFEPLALQPQPDGTTLLTGPVDDQAILHTLLNKIRNLNLDLLSVTYIEANSIDA